MVVDLRLLNKLTIRSSLVLPEIGMQLKCIPSNDVHFAKLDMHSGFDLLRTHEAHQKYFSLTTIFGNIKMCGAPMGFINTPVTYHRMIRYVLGWRKGINPEDYRVFLASQAGALLWIDDILLYADTWKGFMRVSS